MELLASSGVRPRQARYEAALRPDSYCVAYSKTRFDDAPNPQLRFSPQLCANRLFRECIDWRNQQSVRSGECQFASSTINRIGHPAVANLCGDRIIRRDSSDSSQSIIRKQAKLCHRDH